MMNIRFRLAFEMSVPPLLSVRLSRIADEMHGIAVKHMNMEKQLYAFQHE